jgi:hypothetical protein
MKIIELSSGSRMLDEAKYQKVRKHAMHVGRSAAKSTTRCAGIWKVEPAKPPLVVDRVSYHCPIPSEPIGPGME